MIIDFLLGIIQNEVEIADTLRQDGKFWVVVAVMLTLTLGILLYLLLLDKRISKLEREP